MSDIQIDYISDWNARLKTRLYAQFQGDPVLLKFIDLILAPQSQDLEDSLQSLLTITSIDDSEGVNLQVIGRRVGQPWQGEIDVDYRPLLRARVIANNSSGTPEDIYSVFIALFGVGTSMIFIPRYPASFDLRINTPITSKLAQIGAGFLRDSKVGGVKGIFEWQEQPDAQTFTIANATTIRIANFGATSVLKVLSGASFPSSGTVVVDGGLATEETLSYSSISSGNNLVLTTTTTQSHLVGAAVELVGDPGLGFALATAFSLAASIGAISITVFDTSDFPSSGSAILDQKLSTEEIVTFTVTSGTTMSVSALTQNHNIGAAVTLDDPLFGGAFEGAVEV